LGRSGPALRGGDGRLRSVLDRSVAPVPPRRGPIGVPGVVADRPVPEPLGLVGDVEVRADRTGLGLLLGDGLRRRETIGDGPFRLPARWLGGLIDLGDYRGFNFAGGCGWLGGLGGRRE